MWQTRNVTRHLPDDMLLFSIRELLLKEGKDAVKEVEELAGGRGSPSREFLWRAIPAMRS